jgi:A/G-specific adenine glycosylase
MLQQTQMDTMVPYYVRFMQRFPTVIDLAESLLEDVLTMVQGIGYYRRFKLLHQGAKFIVQNLEGIIPNHYESVRKIPGVGDYTAGAIMSIAFNAPYAATDGNVVRVLSRYYGVLTNLALAKEKKKIHELHQKNIEKRQPKVYTQAVMELGALVCKPIRPLCEVCPLQKTCFAFLHSRVKEIPKLDKKTKQSHRNFQTFLWIENNRLALVKNERSLLEGMYLLPQTEQTQLLSIPNSKTFKHVFSHQTWTMHVSEVKPSIVPESVEWFDLDDLSKIPIPIAHQKIIRSLVLIKK